jgi:hypothetical protein
MLCTQLHSLLRIKLGPQAPDYSFVLKLNLGLFSLIPALLRRPGEMTQSEPGGKILAFCSQQFARNRPSLRTINMQNDRSIRFRTA